MVEIWFPYGETKVFASLDMFRVAFEQNLPEMKKMDEKKTLEELMDKLNQIKARRICIYYCTTNHPKIAELLNEFLNEFSYSGGKFEIRLVGPKGIRIKNSLEIINGHQAAIRQRNSEVCEDYDVGIHIGCALPSHLFGISGIGESLLELKKEPISEEVLGEFLTEVENERLKVSLDLIYSVEESLVDKNLISVVFLPSFEGVSDMRIGSLGETASEVSTTLKEMYGIQMPYVDGLIVSLGGAPYDYSMSDSLDMMTSVIQPSKSVEYGFIAEWKRGLGDEKIISSFRKSLKELKLQVLNRFDWTDLIAYVLRTGELLKGTNVLTSLPHTLIKRTIGCRQCETANKLVQRVLHPAGDGKLGIIKSLPNAYLR
ncbi:MAG: hypothetical protein QW201_00785 [Thermoproteota archaeon]